MSMTGCFKGIIAFVQFLSPKQEAVTRLLFEGLTYRDIGRRLSRPRFLVKQIVKEAFVRLDSLGAAQRSEAGLKDLYDLLLARYPAHVSRARREAFSETIRRVLSQPAASPRPSNTTAKIRINELARELEVKPQSIVDLLPELGVTDKKTHSSSLDGDIAAKVRRRLTGKGDEEERPDALGTPDEEYIAVALVEGRFRLVEMRPDGTCRYLDAFNVLHDLIYTVSSETRALEGAIEELEDLLNSSAANEADFQRFFENNPDFITTDEHVEARADIYLTRDGAPTLKPDFMLKPLDPQRTSDLLELKLPSAQVYVLKSRRERLSQAVMEARAQLLEYARYFDDARNRELVHGAYGIFAYRPRMFVVIGRRGSVDPVIRRNAEITADDLHLRTYDDIIERMRNRVKMMRSGGRNTGSAPGRYR
jgi:hypothetical protein